MEFLRQLAWTACYYGFLLSFMVGVYTINLVCLVLALLLPQDRSRQFLQAVAYRLFRLIVRLALLSGILKVDCDLLERLRPGRGGRLIIANHPSMVDAPVILSRIPGLLCVFKSTLKRSFTMTMTARTLGYLSNDEGFVLIKEMAERLAGGNQVLLFPEGTRTSEQPLDPLNPGYALAAIRARVPVQLVCIRSYSPILTKSQHFLKAGHFPIVLTIDLGPCIEPGTFQTAKLLNAYVEDWYRAKIAGPGPIRRPFLPVGYTVQELGDETRVRFRVPDDPFYCDGHMPGNPLVPGYAQMAWVHEVMDACAGPRGRIGFFRWKFLQPLLPGDPVEILIGPPADRRDVAILRDGRRVTQGKLLVSAAEGAP